MPGPSEPAAPGRSFPLFLLALGAAALWLSRGIEPTGLGSNSDPGPRVFPAALALFLIGGAVFEWIQRWRAGRREAPPPRGHWEWRALGRVLALPAGLAACILLIPLIGFLPALGLLAFVMIWLLATRWWKAALYALTMTAAVYFLFVRVFKVPLPGGVWF